MRWIIPAVVVAITALIVFQVNWLMREAEMKTQDEKRRVGEALRETCIAMEEREARAFIGNSLDSVFVRQPYGPDDSMRLEIANDSITQITLMNDTITQIVVMNGSDPNYRRRYIAPPPPLPPVPHFPSVGAVPPMSPPAGLSVLSPVPPLPPMEQAELDQMNADIAKMDADMKQHDEDMKQHDADMKQHEEDMKQHDADIFVIERQQRMCNAVEDVMLQYVFNSGMPTRLDTAVLDSTLNAKLAENGIDYTFSRTFVEGPADGRKRPDTNTIANSKWEFRARLFPGDPDPLSPEIVVNMHPGNASVFMRILPQIIFSVLITFGMLALFLMIYREALRQKKIGEIRRDFINNMTHEFKTPLATMSLVADTIMNEKIIGDKEKVKFYAEQIKFENKKLNQQVEKVLELALTEKTGVHMHMERVNLTEVVLRAMKSMEMQVEAQGGKMLMETSPEVILIDADAFHLERVFVNLLDNALKYGGSPPIIAVTIAPYRSGTEIKITDNGSGIESSDWDLIFEPFHRVSTGDVHNVKGFGLGLSYAQSVMKEHNGSVSVTKSSNSGTTFTVVIMHQNP